jgi:hypothetical protein
MVPLLPGDKIPTLGSVAIAIAIGAIVSEPVVIRDNPH